MSVVARKTPLGLPSRARCPSCGAAVGPGARRCLRCGAAVVRAEGIDLVTFARPAAPYASGDRVAGRYEVIEAYGAGPLGTTYRARDRDGRAVAVKVLPHALLPTVDARDGFVASFRHLCGRAFERVAMPTDVGIDAGAVVFVVSPWVFGASLRRILRAYRAAERRLEPDQGLGVLQGVAAALRELHTVSSHGAVYPENVQVTANSVVLTDAALAAAVPPARLAEHLARFADVLPYLAPEVRAGKRTSAGADLHGVGVLASELLYGDPVATSATGVVLPATAPELEEALRALVSAQAPTRAGALPLALERLLRFAGPASLPPYAPLPSPSAKSEARTRKLRSMAVQGPPPIPPRALKPRSK
ncbi:MAG: inactive serine/threonine-protein kinase VRK3 [Polyangiales bacterium]